MPSSGGAEKKLLMVEGAVSGLQWTPDNRHLVFALRYSDSHFIKDEEKKKEPPVFRTSRGFSTASMERGSFPRISTRSIPSM